MSLSLLLLLSGCKDKKTEINKNNDTPSKSTDSVSASNPPPPPAEPKYYAPYTGEEVSKDVSSNIAFLAMIENSPAARPQSGLSSADIVYEAMTEGGVTRFLALFQKENNEKVGPIRSTRTYFIDLAYEYNLPFAHCGGSHDALDRIKKEKAQSLDEMFNGSYYWRDKTIKIQEHSLYTSTEKLKTLSKEKGYVSEPNVKIKFDKDYWNSINSSQVNNINIKFNSIYSTAYEFKDGLYYKSMSNVQTKNKEDGKPVAIKNVVIQNVTYKTRAKEEYLDANLVGQGDGYIISDGKAIKVKWSKDNLKSQTIFKDESGKIVPLNPGKTWWHLLDQNASLTLK